MNTLRRNIKEYNLHLGRSIAFWTITIALFAVFRFQGISNELGLSIDEKFVHIYRMDHLILGYACLGFIIGILYATIEFVIDKHLTRYVPIGLGVLIYAVLVLVAVIFSSDLVIRVYSNLNGAPFDISPGWWYRAKTFWVLLIYISFASLFFSLLVIVSDKFGRDTFLKILIGHYKKPKVENRVFMFLDLQDSTTIAEKVGHIQYSQVMQDCFYDLNEICPKYDGEIYQYVGDEAVISWSFSKGITNQNCLRLFFEFQNMLDQKASYYDAKYNLKPVFKAGLHGGLVTAAEVGVVKKELAYHGDVVNTAARIQGECNKYQEYILVSKSTLESLNISGSFMSRFVGKVLLKGKHKEVEIFGVDYLDHF
ncbi:MAG: adenylate cyclase [Cyclobacteriaceae bacterium]|jgi:adenylate cyclase